MLISITPPPARPTSGPIYAGNAAPPLKTATSTAEKLAEPAAMFLKYVLADPDGHDPADFANAQGTSGTTSAGLKPAVQELAQGLPAAALNPKPEKLLDAASALDKVRRLAWLPLTRTNHYQETHEKLKKNKPAYLAVKFITCGPLITCVDYLRDKKQQDESKPESAVSSAKLGILPTPTK